MCDAAGLVVPPPPLLRRLPQPMSRRRVARHQAEAARFEAALRRLKDSMGSAPPLSRRAAFRAVWRDRGWGSDADADLAEKRFTMRLSRCRAGPAAPPEAWLRRGSCLAEALGLTEASQPIAVVSVRCVLGETGG